MTKDRKSTIIKYTNADYYLKRVDDLCREANVLDISITRGNYQHGRDFLSIVQTLFMAEVRFIFAPAPNFVKKIDTEFFEIRDAIISITDVNADEYRKAVRDLQKFYYNIMYHMGNAGMFLPKDVQYTRKQVERAILGK